MRCPGGCGGQGVLGLNQVYMCDGCLAKKKVSPALRSAIPSPVGLDGKDLHQWCQQNPTQLLLVEWLLPTSSYDLRMGEYLFPLDDATAGEWKRIVLTRSLSRCVEVIPEPDEDPVGLKGSAIADWCDKNPYRLIRTTSSDPFQPLSFLGNRERFGRWGWEPRRRIIPSWVICTHLILPT